MSNDERRKKKTERLFDIVTLLQSRSNYTSRDLSERLGVTRRTIFRDLKTLADTGVPITYGDDGGYTILEGYQLSPLMITAREAATVLIGLGFMKLQSDPTLHDVADTVEAKIFNVVPEETKSFIKSLQGNTVLDPYWTAAVRRDTDRAGWWHQVTEAIANRTSVVIDYYVESRDEVTRRQVDPLGLVYYTDHWNLIGYDHLRKTIRNFRMDRFRGLKVSMSRFVPPADFSLQDYVDRSRMADEKNRVTIQFREKVAHSAMRTIPSRIEETREVGDMVEVSFFFDSLPFVAQWIRRYGADAVVISPTALQDLVVEQLAEVAALYDK